MPETKKGLVLAGGGAKGSYQVGVWNALRELSWRPDIITGTSVGSLNGAMFSIGMADAARDMWLCLRDSDVLTLPEDEANLSELHRFLHDTVKNGGLDVTPLEEIIDRCLDEKALRASSIRFGLVTVERKGLRRRQLAIEDIPQGMVKDYLLASAACFPAIRPRQIDGTVYLDGGYQDNMPFELAQTMGATELVCVNIDGVGLTRKNKTSLPTILIESHWDLGELFHFSKEIAHQNISLGYYDTLRAFGKVRGTAYAIRPQNDELPLASFRVRYNARLLHAVKKNPTLALTELTALALFNAVDKPLAPLELAAKQAGVPPTELYTIETLCEAFLAHYPPENAEKFSKALTGISPAAAALAGVMPEDFITALVYTALSQPLLVDFEEEEQEVFKDDGI